MGPKTVPEIHPTAVISEDAQLGEGVRIGAFSVVGEQVEIGSGTVVGPHTVIQGPCTIGRGNRITGQSSIGTDPQDLKYGGESSRLLIGNENIIREFVTINRGTKGGGGETRIGDRNLCMTGVHIAHDCRVGSSIVFANAASLAGHVIVDDEATLGAFTGVHQFCRVGTHAFVGAYSVLTRDAVPFVKTVGQRNRAKIYGINSLGLRRRRFASQRIDALRQAYALLFQKGLKLTEAVDQIRKEGLETEDVALIIQFVEGSTRGFVRDATAGGLENDGS